MPGGMRIANEAQQLTNREALVCLISFGKRHFHIALVAIAVTIEHHAPGDGPTAIMVGFVANAMISTDAGVRVVPVHDHAFLPSRPIATRMSPLVLRSEKLHVGVGGSSHFITPDTGGWLLYSNRAQDAHRRAHLPIACALAAGIFTEYPNSSSPNTITQTNRGSADLNRRLCEHRRSQNAIKILGKISLQPRTIIPSGRHRAHIAQCAIADFLKYDPGVDRVAHVIPYGKPVHGPHIACFGGTTSRQIAIEELCPWYERFNQQRAHKRQVLRRIADMGQLPVEQCGEVTAANQDIVRSDVRMNDAAQITLWQGVREEPREAYVDQ